jgi:hypothetical protein
MKCPYNCCIYASLINAYKILVDKPERKRLLEDLMVDVWIILEWILKKYVGRLWTGFIHLRIGTGGGVLRNFGLHKKRVSENF